MFSWKIRVPVLPMRSPPVSPQIWAWKWSKLWWHFFTFSSKMTLIVNWFPTVASQKLHKKQPSAILRKVDQLIWTPGQEAAAAAVHFVAPTFTVFTSSLSSFFPWTPVFLEVDLHERTDGVDVLCREGIIKTTSSLKFAPVSALFSYDFSLMLFKKHCVYF